MLRFKTEVRLAPPVALALLMHVVTDVFAMFGEDTWITSGNDGKHKKESLHYADAALDFRITNIPTAKRAALVSMLRGRLAPQFEVFHEGAGTSTEHLHIEYDPEKKNG